MALSRRYAVRDAGTIVDEIESDDGLHYYTYGALPDWFEAEPFYTGSTEHYPTFSFTPPEGTLGSWLILCSKKLISDNSLIDFGGIAIEVSPLGIVKHKHSICYTTNLVWLDPSGGFETYIFEGKQQAFQDKGKTSTFKDSDNIKRQHRKDEIHQGIILSTGNVSRVHSDFIADLNKSIQAFLWTAEGEFLPILVESKEFRKPLAGEPYSRYEIEFRYAEEDIIQTQ